MAAWITVAIGVNNDYSTRSVAAESGVSQGYATQAKVVAEHAPDLVANVIGGVQPLKAAYDDARRLV